MCQDVPGQGQGLLLLSPWPGGLVPGWDPSPGLVGPGHVPHAVPHPPCCGTGLTGDRGALDWAPHRAWAWLRFRIWEAPRDAGGSRTVVCGIWTRDWSYSCSLEPSHPLCVAPEGSEQDRELQKTPKSHKEFPCQGQHPL